MLPSNDSPVAVVLRERCGGWWWWWGDHLTTVLACFAVRGCGLVGRFLGTLVMEQRPLVLPFYSWLQMLVFCTLDKMKKKPSNLLTPGGGVHAKHE